MKMKSSFRLWQFVICAVFLLWTNNVFSWNCFIHQIVAIIAYENLHDNAKKQMNILSQDLTKSYPQTKNFVAQACLADEIKNNAKGRRYNAWHYINQRVTDKNAMQYQVKKPNVVWAINYLIAQLKSNKLTTQQKAFYVALLVHFVGDIHQPLHTINRYSKQHPQGDLGGNKYKIHAAHADNLHLYWDQGLYFNLKYFANYPLNLPQSETRFHFHYLS
jgi:hypothetical protein